MHYSQAFVAIFHSSYAMVVSNFFARGLSAAALITLRIYVAEIFPTHTRAAAVAISQVVMSMFVCLFPCLPTHDRMRTSLLHLSVAPLCCTPLLHLSDVAISQVTMRMFVVDYKHLMEGLTCLFVSLCRNS